MEVMKKESQGCPLGFFLEWLNRSALSLQDKHQRQKKQISGEG